MMEWKMLIRNPFLNIKMPERAKKFLLLADRLAFFWVIYGSQLFVDWRIFCTAGDVG